MSSDSEVRRRALNKERQKRFRARKAIEKEDIDLQVKFGSRVETVCLPWTATWKDLESFIITKPCLKCGKAAYRAVNGPIRASQCVIRSKDPRFRAPLFRTYHVQGEGSGCVTSSGVNEVIDCGAEEASELPRRAADPCLQCHCPTLPTHFVSNTSAASRAATSRSSRCIIGDPLNGIPLFRFVCFIWLLLRLHKVFIPTRASPCWWIGRKTRRALRLISHSSNTGSRALKIDDGNTTCRKCIAQQLTRKIQFHIHETSHL